VPTTAADHAAIITAFNTAPNTSRSNVFYELLEQEKDSFDLVLPSASADVRRRTKLPRDTSPPSRPNVSPIAL
jgi:hypothetical protein